MPTIARSIAALSLLVASALIASAPCLAQTTVTETCTSQFDCDYRLIQRDDAARTAEYERMVKNQEDAHAAAMQALHAAGARAAGNREEKLAAILQRRRDAYARSQH